MSRAHIFIFKKMDFALLDDDAIFKNDLSTVTLKTNSFLGR